MPRRKLFCRRLARRSLFIAILGGLEWWPDTETHAVNAGLRRWRTLRCPSGRQSLIAWSKVPFFAPPVLFRFWPSAPYASVADAFLGPLVWVWFPGLIRIRATPGEPRSYNPMTMFRSRRFGRR